MRSLKPSAERKSASVAEPTPKTPTQAGAKVTGARKALIRPFTDPMLASPADKPPKGPKWRHEIKFDGYRMQVRIEGGAIRLLTRKGLDWTERFSGVAEALRGLALPSAVLDGELVVEDSAGVSRFSELVGELKTGRQNRFRYYVFDLLHLDSDDLTGKSFLDRKKALTALFASGPPSDCVAVSEDFAIEGDLFFEHVSRLGLEGMVSKRAESPYRSGRTGDWLKSRCVLSQEFVKDSKF